MSIAHPIIAVTGSSGAGTTGVKLAFEQMFRKERIRAAIVEGDSFHRYDRREMDIAVAKAREQGRSVTHFGPEGNLFEELDALFLRLRGNWLAARNKPDAPSRSR